ncbi:MAG: hypothetical protein P8R54_24530 [Myxococcota bacterium]|nr:hypothetical protein [Myxococcota bacterium]
MLWMLMGAASASEPAVVETPTEPTVAETLATPSLLEEARLSRLWLTSDDAEIAQDAALLQQTLDEYSAHAENVFIGEVVNMYHPGGHAINGTQVNIVVSEVIRGEVSSVTEIHVPPPGGYVDGVPDTAPIAIMPGFQMLVFTNADGETVTSNAMFLIDGGFIWRNKAPDVFLNPRNLRDWDLVDPSRDYLFTSLTAVRQQLASR